MLPKYGYKVQNTEDSRTIVLGTIKKILSLPEQKDVFLDLEIRFRHLDTFTTNVVADMTLVKGAEEGEARKKKHKRSNTEKQQKKKKEVAAPPLAPLKAVLRALPSGEYYAVHNWIAPAPRVQLVVEEVAVREVGPDRDDETSKDVLSFETGSMHSSSEKTLQEKIREVEEPVVSETAKKTNSTEQIKEVQKKTPVQPKEDSKEVLQQVEDKKEEPKEITPVQPDVEPKELTQKTTEVPKKPAVLAAGSIETKPGAKKGQTDLLLTVRTTKE